MSNVTERRLRSEAVERYYREAVPRGKNPSASQRTDEVTFRARLHAENNQVRGNG